MFVLYHNIQQGSGGRTIMLDICLVRTQWRILNYRRRVTSLSTASRVRLCTDFDSDVSKCPCRMSTAFPANVHGNVQNMSIYHGGKAPKNQSRMLKNCRIIFWYIYIHTHTHTHPQKGSFFKRFHEEKCKKLGNDSKKCKCRLKRPENVEHMSMSMVPPNVDPTWSTAVHPP